MAYIPPNPNGQAVSASSAPVVIASDQSPIPITGNQSTPVSAAWTSATAANTAITIGTSNLNTATVTMSNTSTMTAGVLTFEVSPDSGTTWFAIAMARIDSYNVETTYTLNTVASRAWSTSVDAFTNFRVRLSTAITGTGTASIRVSAQLFAIEPIITVGQSVASSLQTTAAISSIAAGTNLIGKVNLLPQSTGGATGYTLLSAASTNAVSVKTSAGGIYMISAGNNATSIAYVKLYNKASAPTVGTDTPFMTFMVPASNVTAVPIPSTGIALGTGIAIAITGGAAATDTTSVAANQVQLNIAYF